MLQTPAPRSHREVLITWPASNSKRTRASNPPGISSTVRRVSSGRQCCRASGCSCWIWTEPSTARRWLSRRTTQWSLSSFGGSWNLGKSGEAVCGTMGQHEISTNTAAPEESIPWCLQRPASSTASRSARQWLCGHFRSMKDTPQSVADRRSENNEKSATHGGVQILRGVKSRRRESVVRENTQKTVQNLQQHLKNRIFSS